MELTVAGTGLTGEIVGTPRPCPCSFDCWCGHSLVGWRSCDMLPQKWLRERKAVVQRCYPEPWMLASCMPGKQSDSLRTMVWIEEYAGGKLRRLLAVRTKLNDVAREADLFPKKVLRAPRLEWERTQRTRGRHPRWPARKAELSQKFAGAFRVKGVNHTLMMLVRMAG